MFVEVVVSRKPFSYGTSYEAMLRRVDGLMHGHVKQLIWLLEHKSIYTCGVSTTQLETEQLKALNLNFIHTERGGKVTYHGPGQRIIYFVIDLKNISTPPDIKLFVKRLSECVISALEGLGIESYYNKNEIGIWTKNPSPYKIASIGLKVKKTVVYHGIAVNILNDLTPFKLINPCGLNPDYITSVKNLGGNADIALFDDLFLYFFKKNFHHIDLQKQNQLS
ncbi:Octanoyltransferase [Candidatus Cyrtobacter comes]|uniref:Octanoyltransferase n=1 Tax=Candidatus Cyrtobacter comes TaxID=675776 RepID=A0ABU5L7F8_9RICK|nr:lipoyl(octanoyl) transferase LipB [Candidatus Cyrtobacter comes]MDZ5761977.1 Octanoyltransferase [Candidatus Cyrtobacter comes]